MKSIIITNNNNPIKLLEEEMNELPSGIKWLNYFQLFSRIALGSMFLLSAIHKLQMPYQFLSDIYAYRVVGPTLGLNAAMILPWLELVVAVCLLGNVMMFGALLVSSMLGLVFFTLIGHTLYQGYNIKCGCFGIMSVELVGISTLIRSFGILFLGLLSYISEIYLLIKSRGLKR